VAQADPRHADFFADLPFCAADEFLELNARALLRAPVLALNRSVAARLEHPLLSVGRELFYDRPVACRVMLRFLELQLTRLQIRSENDCPASEDSMADWIAQSMEYGRRLKTQQPELVAQILGDWTQHEAQGLVGTVRRIVAMAGGSDPVRLKGPILEMERRTYEWSAPRFFGQELTRVVHAAGVAMWVPWSCEK
jgi:hypothetical protein